jgi:dihydropteroate synthase
MPGELNLRGLRFAWGERTLVMGIVNVTPDSFSGDGVLNLAAVEHAIAQVERGSDIVDVGGESTRPGHQRIGDDEEIARVVPVITAVREFLPAAPISIDTYKPAVARAACRAGADLINSVWGLSDALLDVAIEFDAALAIMHNRERAEYDGSVVDEVLRFLDEAARRAVARGVAPQRVIVDPGIGFGKTAEHNIEVLRELPRLASLGFPTLLGTSRKSTIGKLTGRDAGERLFGTAATTALAVQAGIDAVRVHDVVETRDVLAVADAIVRGWRPQEWTK